MKITRIGVDIAKSVFHVHGVDRHGETLWQGKYKRQQWLNVLSKRVAAGSEIGLEACASSHYWGRELQKRGFKVKLIAAQFVKPYVKSNKNDRIDAEAICEAMSRPSMRYVSIKSIEQQDIQAAHRIREELVAQRTAKANQIRGLVGEYGLIAPVGIGQLRKALPEWLEDAENGLTDEFRKLLSNLGEDFRYLDNRVKQKDGQIQHRARNTPLTSKLLELRGCRATACKRLDGRVGRCKTFFQRA